MKKLLLGFVFFASMSAMSTEKTLWEFKVSEEGQGQSKSFISMNNGICTIFSSGTYFGAEVAKQECSFDGNEFVLGSEVSAEFCSSEQNEVQSIQSQLTEADIFVVKSKKTLRENYLLTLKGYDYDRKINFNLKKISLKKFKKALTDLGCSL